MSNSNKTIDDVLQALLNAAHDATSGPDAQRLTAIAGAYSTFAMLKRFDDDRKKERSK